MIGSVRYKAATHVAMTEFEGEAVLLDVAAGAYYGLDDVGTAVWRLIEEQVSLEEIVQALVQRYDVEEDHLLRDVRQLVSDMVAERLLEVVERR